MPNKMADCHEGHTANRPSLLTQGKPVPICVCVVSQMDVLVVVTSPMSAGAHLVKKSSDILSLRNILVTNTMCMGQRKICFLHLILCATGKDVTIKKY